MPSPFHGSASPAAAADSLPHPAAERPPVRGIVHAIAVLALETALLAACVPTAAAAASAAPPQIEPALPTSPPPAAREAAPAADTAAVEALRQELAALRSEYESRIAALESRLAALAEPPGAEPAVAAALPPPLEAAPPPLEAAPPPVTEGVAPALGSPAAQTSNYFNPAIALVGNFLAVAGTNGTDATPAAELRESELALGAVVDPYARADVFLAFGEEGVELEEGFVTFTALPANLLLEVGRLRATFGKVNSQHLHTRSWPDTPLPFANLLGSEEGWIGTGVSLAKLLPIGDTFTEATVEVFRGEAEGLFAGERRGDLAYNAHYRLFRDLTEAGNLDLGLSYGRGPNGRGEGTDTRLAGLDLTYRWKPLQTGRYRSALLRGEVFHSDLEDPGGDVGALGWYLSGDLRLNRRWTVGARTEWSQHADDDTLADRGQALLLTFWPSEFAQLRSELRRRHYDATDETADELLMQLQFAIGAHGAHPF
jgi:hypothetical protein